jgi:methylenetetrahydrofolate reductase (NADPH)
MTAAAVSPAPDAIRHIAAFTQGFSLEAIRPPAAEIDALASVLPRGTHVYLSAVPTRPQHEVIEPARRLHAAGFEPVPHIAVRHAVTTDALDDLIARLSGEAGVRRLLVIAGDRDRPAGPFGSTIELIESGLLQRHGITEIGVAGYPDGHPRISADALDRALAAKVNAAEQTGLDLHIVTQFCFDAEPILHWLARLRDLGIEHPVRIGLAGPTTLTTLLRYARRCGVAASAQGLTRQGGLLKHLVGTTAPDGIIRALAETPPGRIGEVAVHFFSFGGVAATARWAQATADGRITIDRAEGFSAHPP